MEWPDFNIPFYIPFGRLTCKLSMCINGTLKNNCETIDDILSKLSPEDLKRAARENFTMSYPKKRYHIFHILAKKLMQIK
jgi:hypothetical protein